MKLNEYLKKEKLSIAKFAMKCGIPFPTISKYYYGEKIPRQENMHKIYQYTEKKVDANDFYGIK
jgi:transcriptional regulator with XRE-family HTH domain